MKIARSMFEYEVIGAYLVNHPDLVDDYFEFVRISMQQDYEWLRQHTPMNRFGDAEELVGAAIYLLSPAASFTTGETIIVDGGFLASGVNT